MENKNIITALAQFRSKIETIKKDSTNPHFKSKYADLPSILEAIKQPLADSGLTIYHQAENTESGYVVTTILAHGEERIISRFPIFWQKPQEIGSSMTYARRYNLQCLLDLPTDDDDWNIANEAPKTAQQPAKPYITKTNIDWLVKNIREGVTVCATADEAIKIAQEHYTVAGWAKDEIKEKTKSIFL